MQQPTSSQLYAYWDHVRNGRVAPRRFEIEPSMIAAVLPETFIVDRQGRIRYKHVGPLTQADLERKILPLVAKLEK